VNSNLKLDSTFTTPNVKSHELLKENFYRAFSTEDMFNENKFVCLINDTLLDDDTPFSELKKRAALKLEPSDDGYRARLMENLIRATSIEQTSENLDSIYELSGVCNLVVLLHHSLSLDELKRLLIYDLMRSLHARVRLLVEDLDASKDIIGNAQVEDPDANDVSTIEESYQTPNRIHVLLNEGDMLICDYVFPDETYEDIGERIQELFSLKIAEPAKDIVFVEDLSPEIRRSDALSKQKSDAKEDLGLTGGLSDSTMNSTFENSRLNRTGGLMDFGYSHLRSLMVLLTAVLLVFFSYKAANYINDEDEVML